MSVHVRNLAWWVKGSFKPNSVVVITGAASGIGMNIAYIYARRQCRLVLMDMNGAALNEVSKKCVAFGSTATSLEVDVTQATQVKAAFQRTLALHGTIDLLILCAGIGAHHLFQETQDLSVFRKLMEVNFFGYLHCLHSAYDALCSSNGQVVAITSFSGEVGLPFRTAYCASKFAVTGLLESLRAEMDLLHQQQQQQQQQGPHSATRVKGRFDITIVCPPSVDTNLRKNSLTINPDLKDAPPKYSMTVEQCAVAIVDAADRRLRKAFFPATSFFASYLRPLVPDVMDKLIMKRAKL